MSESIRRKSSSRELLQNLISVTAQRSQEDAEEVEREQRRRARETQRGEGSPPRPEPPRRHDTPRHDMPSNETPRHDTPRHDTPRHDTPSNEMPHNTAPDEELKPRSRLVLEEDEGFSDWSHRLENRGEQEVQKERRAGLQRPTRRKPRPEEEQRQEGGEEVSIDGKEVKTTYSSKVFLSHDARPPHAADRTSHLVAGTMRPRGGACRVDGEAQQEVHQEVYQEAQQEAQAAEQRQPHRAPPRDEDDQEEEEKEDLHLTREEKHREEEEEQQEEQQEEPRMPDKSWMESSRRSSRRSEEGNPADEDEEPVNYGPMSPTFKKLLIQFYPEEVTHRAATDAKCSIMERTESLRRSGGSVKKTLTPVAVSKIDKKLELYAHALQVSTQEGRSAGQAPADLASPTEPVSSKKSLFEAGEARSHTAATPSKDADGVKVGVANLINQWVRGGEDGSRCSSPSRPAENSSGKKHKFLVTGHGKYQKVPVDRDCSEEAGCSPAGAFCEDL
ncbi:lymphocyte-specific protein 1-like isoform X2 [Pseudoliparis swirei]|uniref:lymphocyte-specific protein 1-like isoform X2 n=1 Tax=Pseudoliparis swirei TaxID=2059687 RepID=UPI0024BE26FA|nr:lymphocyte-specific protein 1-like isoform X2 [Pseudoliparis swirei]